MNSVYYIIGIVENLRFSCCLLSLTDSPIPVPFLMLPIPQYTGAGEVAERSRGEWALLKPTGAMPAAYSAKYCCMRNV
jgi:hypothetical protein